METSKERVCDVVVVGAGLGGLVAATLLARRGLRVEVYERAKTVGGRAVTRERSGFLFNEGGHALYRGGAAARALRRAGIRWTGRRPSRAGLAMLRGQAHGLPTTLGALFATSLLSWSAKVRAARVMARMRTVDTRALAGISWRRWLEAEVLEPAVRAVLGAFVRVSTYTDAPDVVSAGATLDQLRLASDPGVEYVDGGWGAIVSAAAETARAAGVTVHAGVGAECAARSGSCWSLSTTRGAATAAALVLATGPATARSIVASEFLARAAFRAIPAKVACLDVGLSRLPDPSAGFALGVDRPLYLSVHSRTARVAPAGAALVSLMKYAAPGAASDPAADLAEMEALLDRLQPGWRVVEIERQWLPSMTASNAMVTAQSGGRAGRPLPQVPDAPSLWIAGDWVGDEGMLLDASLASAERAADEVSVALAEANVA